MNPEPQDHMKREAQEKAAQDVAGWDCNKGRPHFPTPATPGAALEQPEMEYPLPAWAYAVADEVMALNWPTTPARENIARIAVRHGPQPAKSQVTPSDSTGTLPPAWAVDVAESWYCPAKKGDAAVDGLIGCILAHAPPPVPVSPPAQWRPQITETCWLAANDCFGTKTQVVVTDIFKNGHYKVWDCAGGFTIECNVTSLSPFTVSPPCKERDNPYLRNVLRQMALRVNDPTLMTVTTEERQAILEAITFISGAAAVARKE